MAPVVALLGTIVVIVDALTLVKDAVTLLNETSVVPDKFWPVIVTVVPGGPDEGVKLAIECTGTTVNEVVLCAVPPGVVTRMAPVVALLGTVAVIVDALTMVKVVAVAPLNETAVVPDKFLPVIVTVVPVVPDEGVKLAIEGTGTTVNEVELCAVPPPGVVTRMAPVVALLGTVAVIVDALTLVKDAVTLLNETAVVPDRFWPVI